MSVTKIVSNIPQVNHDQIRNAKFCIEKIPSKGESGISTAAISNNLKYITVGYSDREFDIWKLGSRYRIKSIKFNHVVFSCKFTNDSQLLYVGIDRKLYQFYVNNNFKKLSQLNIHDGSDNYAGCIHDIFCISNTIVLTSFSQLIIKTDVTKKQQLLKIQAINNHVCGFDYNKHFNLIASGSAYGSIMLWNGNDGQLNLEKIYAHNHYKPIFQVLFIFSDNQLISLDIARNVIIWMINYQTNQLELFKQIQQYGSNISLVQQQQYLLTIGRQFIKINTIKGELIRQLDHQMDTIRFFNTIQHDCMKVVLILGRKNLHVCKIEFN